MVLDDRQAKLDVPEARQIYVPEGRQIDVPEGRQTRFGDPKVRRHQSAR